MSYPAHFFQCQTVNTLHGSLLTDPLNSWLYTVTLSCVFSILHFPQFHVLEYFKQYFSVHDMQKSG